MTARVADLQPSLKGERVMTRPLLASDYDALYAVAADPLIWEQHPAGNRHRENVFRAFFEQALEDGSLAVLDAQSGIVIGSTRFYNYLPQQGEVEIGYTFLARSQWATGANPELKRLMLRHAFGFVHRVVFLIGPDNKRSQRAVEKIGGVRRGYRRARNQRLDCLFEIGRHAYLNGEERGRRQKGVATRLSVNLNKVALLRNQRDVNLPSVMAAADAVLSAGAQGITLHPRPDGRHVRPLDVRAVGEMLREDPSRAELNVEGNPTEAFLELVAEVRPDQVTLVPDAPDAPTSEEGWDLDVQRDFLVDMVGRLKGLGMRVALFVNPDPGAPRKAKGIGADRVELYTGLFARSWGTPAWEREWLRHEATCRAARDSGIGLNAGHDLNLNNLPAFLEMAPGCCEVSIGHAITADALDLGWAGAVRAYLAIIREARAGGTI